MITSEEKPQCYITNKENFKRINVDGEYSFPDGTEEGIIDEYSSYRFILHCIDKKGHSLSIDWI